MKDWTGLLFAFVFGFAAGMAFSALLFGSRLRLYREYIERRLAAINLLHLQSLATPGLHKSSFMRAIFKRRARSREDASSIRDE